ncbi:MAG: hypothetical protein J5I93_10205, partial [Pirellulaceae bacterium]|nr:hypothetical protein [Pirellulaceae bacterium]
MSAEKFLDRLEEQGLLDHKIIGELRSQVAKKPKKVTAEAIAKLLVDSGHLTRFQASKLVSDVSNGDGGEPATAEAATTIDDELGFAPDEEEMREPVPGEKKRPGGGAKPAAAPQPAGKPAQAAGPAAPGKTKPRSQPAPLTVSDDDDEIVDLEAAPAQPAPR